MTTDGVIKFKCSFSREALADSFESQELLAMRNILKSIGAIGVTSDGIGYGNISLRLTDNTFLISGSGTGNVHILTLEGLSLVNDYSIETNSLSCSGLTKASSESLTHAAIYDNCKGAKCVIHLHNLALWEKLFDKYPTSNPAYEYGTPAIALEIGRLAGESAQAEGIIIMGGHKEGILVFSHSATSAMNIVNDLYGL